MTSNLLPQDVSGSLLLPLMPSDTGSLQSIAMAFQQVFTFHGLRSGIEHFDNWVCITIAVDRRLLSFAVMAPETPELLGPGPTIRIGVDLSCGLPSGEELNDRPDTFFYPPSDFTLGNLLDLCRGRTTPGVFTDLLNASNRFAMSLARVKFPNSILVMSVSRQDRRTAGDRHFDLWTQTGGRAHVHTLHPTNNPHQAALQANEMGYWPTIYRCVSGHFVAFKSTDGGVFL